MGYQNISYTMPQEDIDAVKAAINTIGSKMPFLITLTNDEMKGLVKLGPKSADFVKDAAVVVTNFGDILPSTFNKDEFLKDTALFVPLSEIKLLLDSLTEKIDNTYIAVGSEAMSESLEIYAHAQTVAGKVPGLQSVTDKLSERFKRSAKSKTTTQETK